MACELGLGGGLALAIVQFKKGDEYIARIEKMARESREKILGPAIYDAANVVTDAVREKLSTVPTDERWVPYGTVKAGPRKVELVALENSLGIAKLQDNNGFLNVKVGFDGYNGLQTKTWPQGQPNSMVARAIQSGTSWMSKQPFMRKAEQASKAPCEAVMSEVVDREIAKIMKQ